MQGTVPRRPRCRVTRAIPLFDEHGIQVRVVKPGTKGAVVSVYDGSGPSTPRRDRALVRFDDHPGEWDVSRDSIWVEEVQR